MYWTYHSTQSSETLHRGVISEAHHDYQPLYTPLYFPADIVIFFQFRSQLSYSFVLYSVFWGKINVENRKNMANSTGKWQCIQTDADDRDQDLN